MSRPSFTIRWNEVEKHYEMTVVESERLIPPIRLDLQCSVARAHGIAEARWSGKPTDPDQLPEEHHE